MTTLVVTVKNEFGGRDFVRDVESDKPMLFESVEAVTVFLNECDLPLAAIQSVRVEDVCFLEVE
jgi:hypothetical protein